MSLSSFFRRCAVLAVAAALAAGGAAPAAPAVRLSSLDKFEGVEMKKATESFEDFEKPAIERYWQVEGAAKMELSGDHATTGKKSLKVRFHDDASVLRYRRPGLDGYGSHYSRALEILGSRFLTSQRFIFDAFNPYAFPVELEVTFGVKTFPFTLKPGANTVSVSTEDVASGVYRMTQATNRIVFHVVEADDFDLTFDSFRLERETVGVNTAALARCVDFGPADMARPGFIPVEARTGYDPRRGCGWLKPNSDGDKEKLHNEDVGGAAPLPELLRDGVSNLNSPFLMDLPDGKYRVHLAGGYHWGGIQQLTPIDYDFTIRSEGEVKYLHLRASDHAERVKMFYGNDRVPYDFDEDVWAKFGAPVYGPIVFDVEVKHGQLSLEFQTSPQPDKGFLNFLIVYPVSQAGKIEPEIGRLWYNLRRQYNRVGWRPLDPALAVEMKKPDLHEEYLDPALRIEKISMLLSRPEFSGRSFMLFARDPLDQVYPDTVPSPGDEARRLAASASPGETVPVTFGIFPLRDLEGVRVDVDPFDGPKGARIPREDVDLRCVRYDRRMLGETGTGDWQYMVVPWYLLSMRPIDLPRYMPYRFWLDVQVPAGLAAGKYRSTIRVSGRGFYEVRLPAELTVQSYRLVQPDAGRFCAVYLTQPSNPGNEAFGYSERFLATSRLPRETAQTVTRQFEEYDRQEIRAVLEALRRGGFDTLYLQEWHKDVKDTNRALNEPMSVVDLVMVGRNAKNRPKPGTTAAFVYVDPVEGKAYLASLASCTEETIRSLKDEKLKVYIGWPQPGMHLIDDAGVARFLPGVYHWRSGADGVVIGPVRASWGDPYHPFDGYGGEPGSLLMPSSTDWPLPNPSRIYEEVREGIKDYRALVTLERLVAAAGDRREAREARDFLNRLRVDTSPNLADYVENCSGSAGWRMIPDKGWTSDRYNQFRHDVISHIIALQGVVSVLP